MVLSRGILNFPSSYFTVALSCMPARDNRGGLSLASTTADGLRLTVVRLDLFHSVDVLRGYNLRFIAQDG